MTRLYEITEMAIDTNGIKVILDQHHYDGIHIEELYRSVIGKR
jgi:aryl-phospho-beta-D-glucosidase BglC (GH1 family)